MGTFLDDLDDHEGYADRRLPNGQLAGGVWTYATREFTAYVAACGCGWQATGDTRRRWTARPPAPMAVEHATRSCPPGHPRPGLRRWLGRPMAGPGHPGASAAPSTARQRDSTDLQRDWPVGAPAGAGGEADRPTPATPAARSTGHPAAPAPADPGVGWPAGCPAWTGSPCSWGWWWRR